MKVHHETTNRVIQESSHIGLHCGCNKTIWYLLPVSVWIFFLIGNFSLWKTIQCLTPCLYRQRRSFWTLHNCEITDTLLMTVSLLMTIVSSESVKGSNQLARVRVIMIDSLFFGSSSLVSSEWQSETTGVYVDTTNHGKGNLMDSSVFCSQERKWVDEKEKRQGKFCMSSFWLRKKTSSESKQYSFNQDDKDLFRTDAWNVFFLLVRFIFCVFLSLEGLCVSLFLWLTIWDFLRMTHVWIMCVLSLYWTLRIFGKEEALSASSLILSSHLRCPFTSCHDFLKPPSPSSFR
jgi:hypothetical protein